LGLKGLVVVAFPAPEGGQNSRMVEQDKTDGWDEVLEETDELAGVHKDPLGAPFLSSGTSRSVNHHLCLKFDTSPVISNNLGSDHSNEQRKILICQSISG
jgi:hypothetical protein